jgi:hypothetical protein
MKNLKFNAKKVCGNLGNSKSIRTFAVLKDKPLVVPVQQRENTKDGDLV